MSAALWGQAFYIPMPAPRKLVLLYLCSRADERGEKCFPSQELISACTGLTTRCVREHTRALEESGYVQSSIVQDGFKRHLTYRVDASRVLTDGKAANERFKNERNDVPVESELERNDVPIAAEHGSAGERNTVPVIRQSDTSDHSSYEECDAPRVGSESETAHFAHPVALFPVQPASEIIKLPRRKGITAAFVEQMRCEYGPLLKDFDERLQDALNHKNADRWKDQCRYLRNWLARDSQDSRYARSAQNAQSPPPRKLVDTSRHLPFARGAS